MKRHRVKTREVAKAAIILAFSKEKKRENRKGVGLTERTKGVN